MIETHLLIQLFEILKAQPILTLFLIFGTGYLIGDIVQTFSRVGPTMALAGIVVTMMPMAVTYFFGRKVLKLNPVLLLGAITGAMNSDAALSVVTREAKSSVSALGYTGAYAFSSVLLAIARDLILVF